MNESAVRAERVEFRSSNSPSFLWRVQTEPVAVRLSLEVVEHLGREVLENFRSVSARGSEIGGLLLGTYVAGEQPEVLVERYECIPCDYSRGPLYRLSELDKQRFDAAIRSHQDSGELSVVGYFRSNTRKGLSLDPEDLAFLTSRFRDPGQIALLVRPFATKTSIGGIFVWKDGAIQGDASPREFPFSAAELERMQAAESASAAPKPAARAQVVPIALRRDTSNVADATIDLEIPPPPAPPQPVPVVVPAQPVAVPAPAPESIVPAPEPVPPATEPEPPAPKPVMAEPPAPAPIAAQPAPSLPVEAPSFGMPAKARRAPEAVPEKKGRIGIWIGAGLAAAAAAVALFVYPGFLNKSSAPVAAPQAPLSLRAERTAGDLLVTWNRDAESVRTAVKAVLTINDGPQHENLNMDLAQLRNGSVVYTPATPDVSFRLDVTSSDPAKSQNELLRVLKTPGQAPAEAAKTTAPQPDKATAPAPAAAPAAPAAEPARTPRVASRAFNASTIESPASRLRAARPSDLPEPPPASGGPSAPPMNLGGAPSAPVALPSAPPAPAPAPARAQPTPAAKVGGDVQPAELRTRRDPSYPPLARQSRVDGSVILEARIGTDGRVKEVKVLQGHPMLRAAAADAVKQWTYKPANLNGQPVESSSRVEVHFVGGK